MLCTGDEVVSAGTYPLPPGKIYNSNLQLILSRLQELGIWSMVGKQVGDSSKAICDSIDQLAQGCDLLVTTGGVSVGDKDLLLEALSKLKAETIFRRIKMKPGSPAAFLYTERNLFCRSLEIHLRRQLPLNCWCVRRFRHLHRKITLQ